MNNMKNQRIVKTVAGISLSFMIALSGTVMAAPQQAQAASASASTAADNIIATGKPFSVSLIISEPSPAGPINSTALRSRSMYSRSMASSFRALRGNKRRRALKSPRTIFSPAILSFPIRTGTARLTTSPSTWAGTSCFTPIKSVSA